jgi:competence protein ComEA
MKTRVLICALAAVCLALPAGAFGAAVSIPAANAVVTAEVRLVNVNKATIEELDAVSGIGPVLAKRIVEYRKKNGPFKNIDDLVNVSGIGPKNLEGFKALLTAEPAP